MFGRPQDLPAGRQFLIGCVAASFITLFFGYRLLFPIVNPLLFAIAHTLLIGVSWIALLAYCKKLERWLQSASAVFGCGAITNLVSLPIYSQALESGIAGTADAPGPGVLLLLLPRIWELAISALIIRESIEISTGRSIGLAVIMSFAIEICLSMMFKPG